MDKNQTWICLSNKKFETKKYNEIYSNNEHRIIGNPELDGFKPVGGMWFSLPSTSKFYSYWGEFVLDDSHNKKVENWAEKNVMNIDGETNIIQARLKDNTYVVTTLDEWVNVVQDFFMYTDVFLSSEQKRNMFLDKVKERTCDDSIEQIVLNIRYQDLDVLTTLRNQFNNKVEDFRTMCHSCYNDEMQKRMMLLLCTMYINEPLTLDMISGYIPEETCEKFKKEIEQDENYLSKMKRSFGRRFGGHFIGVENAKKLCDMLSEHNNEQEYKAFINKICFDSKKAYGDEMRMVSNLFSGMIKGSEEWIAGWDMPSLVVFDTDCLDVISENWERIYEMRKEKDLDDFDEI